MRCGVRGTLAGVGEYLKGQNKDIKIGLADPDGAKLHGYYTTGELSGDGGSVSEGIGQGRITENLVGFTPDFSYNIPDSEAIPLLYPLLKDEALCMGGSTAINIAGAIRMAKDMAPAHTIVTILCDHGSRYASKLHNPAWLAKKACRSQNGFKPERNRAGESNDVSKFSECGLAEGPFARRQSSSD